MKLYRFAMIAVLSTRAFASPFSEDPLALPPAPIEVGGPIAGTIIGNNGDLFGGEFSKIIRVDIYQKLESMFAHRQIPANHPLAILKDKMPKLKALLDDQYRVYAVDPRPGVGEKERKFTDVFGEEVLARVVPLRYAINRQDLGTETSGRFTAEAHLTQEEFDLQGKLSLESSQFQRVIFASDGTAQVRVSGDFIDSHGQPLPPGFKFYSKCADMQELAAAATRAKKGESSTVVVMCNGYRFDGAVATIDGILRVTAEGSYLKISADLDIQLEFQSYVIEVNRPRFARLLLERGQKNMQILVFHEYLRLTGIDDEGYKISVYARNLDDVAAGKKITFVVGDQVMIAKGITTILTTDQSATLAENPEGVLNPITYRGTIEKVMTKSYRLRQLPFVQDGQLFYGIDAVVPKAVVKVRAIDASTFVKPVQYFWLDDMTPYQIVIKD